MMREDDGDAEDERRKLEPADGGTHGGRLWKWVQALGSGDQRQPRVYHHHHHHHHDYHRHQHNRGSKLRL